MTDEVLAPFLEAYRVEHSARRLDTLTLRRRVLASTGRGRLRSVDRMRVLLPLAATLAGSVALAASPPARERVREVIAFVRSGVMPRFETTLNTPPKPRSPGIAGPATPRSLAGTELAPPVQAEHLPVTPEKSPVLHRTAADGILRAPSREGPGPAFESEPAPTTPPPLRPNDPEPSATASFVIDPSPLASVAPTATPSSKAAQPRTPDEDLALYQRAHRLHFSRGDRSLALNAWDAYLKAFPRGTFAPEARLNRAVCLAQLGQRDEAEKVLTEIERGRFGKDGRTQAGKVLRAIDED